MIAPSVLAIRPASRRDIEQLTETRVASWRHAYRELLPAAELARIDHATSRARFAEEIRARDPRRAVLVVEDPQGIFGYVWTGPQKNVRWPHRGEIFELYVHPDHHGRGAGSMLLTAALHRLFSANLQPVLVWVLSRNPARTFYERCGGRFVARRALDLQTTRIWRAGYEWTDHIPTWLERTAALAH